MNHNSPASKFAESLLVGAIESVARAGAKALESVVGDAKKALRNEAFKAELLEKGIEAWRKMKLGDVDDLPASLRDDPPFGVSGSSPFPPPDSPAPPNSRYSSRPPPPPKSSSQGT